MAPPLPVCAHGDQALSAKCRDSAPLWVTFTYEVAETGLAG